MLNNRFGFIGQQDGGRKNLLHDHAEDIKRWHETSHHYFQLFLYED